MWMSTHTQPDVWLCITSDDSSDTSEAHAAGDSLKTSTDRPKILIVDDDIDLAESLQDLLEFEGGCDVETATSITRGRTALLNFKPSVVLVDIKLGRDNGLMLIPDIKRLHPHAVCMVMTAYRDDSQVREARRLGADHFLHKPLDPPLVLKAIEAAANSGRSGLPHLDS